MSTPSSNPPPPPTTPSSLLSRLREVAEVTFEEGHGHPPYDWQGDDISHLLMIKASPQTHPSGPVLIVHCTGGGKSAVRNTFGFACEGVILTLVPLLSLGADQSTKLAQLCASQSLPSSIRTFHLDEYRSPSVNASLQRMLQSLPDDTDETIFLFSSPQKLAGSVQWSSTIASLIGRNFHFSLCIDECHLYAQFGLELVRRDCRLSK